MLFRALAAMLALALVPALLTAPRDDRPASDQPGTVLALAGDDVPPRPDRNRADRSSRDDAVSAADRIAQERSDDSGVVALALQTAEEDRAAQREADEAAAREAARQETMQRLDDERRAAAEERRRKEEEERRAREEAERRAELERQQAREAQRKREAEEQARQSAAKPARQSAPAPAPKSAPKPAPAPAVAGGGVWDRLAQCESGGNWSINTGNGYYGGLQFAPATWRSVGGSGLPHQHSREEQIRRGQILQARAGWGQWPACSRKLGLR